MCIYIYMYSICRDNGKVENGNYHICVGVIVGNKGIKCMGIILLDSILRTSKPASLPSSHLLSGWVWHGWHMQLLT